MPLHVGGRYVAVGPNPQAAPAGVKTRSHGWWDPPVVEVLAVRDDGAYVTRPAGVILPACAQYWRPA